MSFFAVTTPTFFYKILRVFGCDASMGSSRTVSLSNGHRPHLSDLTHCDESLATESPRDMQLLSAGLAAFSPSARARSRFAETQEPFPQLPRPDDSLLVPLPLAHSAHSASPLHPHGAEIGLSGIALARA